ncbi:hypothetical protein QAD02_018410 [Eretmocerus hayati]|uniref:Uncharacterized protein n=1 Tax=Eretmocerus hayati TaxID=131215 RepID=A0ACC2PHW2_9HYME|nr:hypothetical protein QAD02_018410 [Eretmocerus hayati]
MEARKIKSEEDRICPIPRVLDFLHIFFRDPHLQCDTWSTRITEFDYTTLDESSRPTPYTAVLYVKREIDRASRLQHHSDVFNDTQEEREFGPRLLLDLPRVLMKRDRFLYIRTSWGECFPKDAEGDNPTIVYEPSSTGVDAKGHLYVAYIHYNGNSYETGLLEKPKRKSNITDTDAFVVTQRAELQILRALKLVTDENTQTWIPRLSVRLDFYLKLTLDEMLNDLIILEADNAADLTQANFGVIYNGKENASLNAWPTLSSALIDLARFKSKTVKDKQDILNCLTTWGDEPEGLVVKGNKIQVDRVDDGENFPRVSLLGTFYKVATSAKLSAMNSNQ